jgi:hypothetical protein
MRVAEVPLMDIVARATAGRRLNDCTEGTLLTMGPFASKPKKF